MDQLKAFLKQAAKHRFWIVVAVSALLPMIAYFAASGSIKADTAKQAGDIKSAKTDVIQYVGVPNPDATRHVDAEVARISKDVNKTWRELYDRQAPLLTWPSTVGDQFTKWGRTWPKADESQIQAQIGFYIQGYPPYVDEVYKTFKPWDPEEGTGIVVAPGRDELLRPAELSISNPPTYGTVWSTQEKLWLQATLLDVVAKVNKDATDWDSAKIKAITGLEVGSQSAAYRDQQSIAAGETLKEAEDPDPSAKKKAATSAAGGPAGKSMFPGMPGAGGGMAGMPGMPGMGGDTKTTSISYVVTKGAAPYRLYPVYLSVLIEQNAMMDLLAEMEKSPMAIQVRDFEMARPEVRVVKPEKGKDPGIAFSGSGMGGGMGGPGLGAMMLGMGSATGTPMKSALEMMKMRGAMPGMPTAGGGMPGMATAGGPLEGKEGHKVERKKKTEEGAEKKEPPPKVEIFDPYYNVVEVKVYGLARIYNAPPPLPAGPASSSPTAAPAAPPTQATPKPEAAPAPETKAPIPAPAPEPAKAKTEPAKAKTEPPKADAGSPKPATEPAKTEPPKVEAKPAAPKPEPAKSKTQPEPAKSATGAPAPKS